MTTPHLPSDLQVDEGYRVQLSGDTTLVYRGTLAAAFAAS